MDTFALDIINKHLPTHFTKHSASLLDFFIVVRGNADSCISFNQVSIPGISSHDLIYCSYCFENNICNEYITYRNFSDVDIQGIKMDTLALPWDNIYFTPYIDNKLTILNEYILMLLDKHAPIKERVIKHNECPWFNPTIKRTILDRDLSYQVWKRCPGDENRKLYVKLRNYVTKLKRNSKRAYAHSRLSMRLPLSKLWRNMKNIGMVGMDSVDYGAFTADDFNNFFTANRNSVHVSNFVEEVGGLDNGFSFHNVSAYDVLTAINSLKSYSLGLDGLPLKFVKLIIPYIIPYLTNIFNTVLTTSYFPKIWKLSKIVPLPKKSQSVNLCDYRPISILSTLAKALESIMKSQICVHLDSGCLLSSFQSGFRALHSTTTALLKVTHDIRRNFERDFLSILVLLDFSKAFDTVNCDILCYKLKTFFKFSTAAVLLINSYLTDRRQMVVINNNYSQNVPVLLGVPQGSVLGPLLFSMFINDFPNILSGSSCHMFADDVQIYRSCSMTDIGSCVSLMNEELARVSSWALENGLELNGDKSRVMVVYRKFVDTTSFPRLAINSVDIPYSVSMKNLGIIMNPTLTWGDDVNVIIR